MWHKRLKFTVNNCFKKVILRQSNKNNIKCAKFQKRKKAIFENKCCMKNIAEAELIEEDEQINLSKLKFNLDRLNDKTNVKQNNLWKINIFLS